MTDLSFHSALSLMTTLSGQMAVLELQKLEEHVRGCPYHDQPWFCHQCKVWREAVELLAGEWTWQKPGPSQLRIDKE
jgi:hypothetical protein